MSGGKKILKVATVFSGIGAFEEALKQLCIPHEILFACDNGERYLKQSYEEIMDATKEMSNEEREKYVDNLYQKTGKTNFVKQSYFANHEITEDRWHNDIRFLNGEKYKNKIDILVGGSPCQSFSIIGKRAGLEDTRGTLFYDFARLVSETKPKAFIFENVPGMLTHDKGNTWKVIVSVFHSLGYKISSSLLNARDYGIPQERKRLFVVGFKDVTTTFEFPAPVELTTTMKDYLEDYVPAKHYLGKKGFEFVTNEKYKNRARVNVEIIQTQKANQQFNWNGDFVFEPLSRVANRFDVMARAYVSTWNNQKGVIRQLSYRECLRLMGFSDNFKIVVPNVPAYRQAGNSIAVPVLKHLTREILTSLNFDGVRRPIRLATVFSGIGAVEFAFKRLGIETELVFACDNGEREIQYDIDVEREAVLALPTIDAKQRYVEDLYASKTTAKNYVQQSYLENYPHCPKNRYFQDIVLLDGRDFEGKVDIFVGGSPCQSFSSVGFQHGLEDARGTLFYEFARLVKEIKPKVFIYENVRNLIKHDNGNTWNVIKGIFDSLGYKYKFDVLNASDYGIPQTRRRLFVVGFLEDVDFDLPSKQPLKYKMKDFMINNCREGGFLHTEDGSLIISPEEGEVDSKYILTEKLYAYVMNSGTKTFYSHPKINLDIARTLLKTMGNRHRAGVDNYVSFDGTEELGSVRMLTEREAHRLMGFTDDYKIVVSRAQAYKQAGNSIVVDVLMAIVKKIVNAITF